MSTLDYILAQLHYGEGHDDEAGQTMAEYAVVLGVITVLVVGTFVLLSNGITSTLTNVIGDL